MNTTLSLLAGVYSKVSSQWTWIKDTICDGHSSPKPGFCDGVPPSPTPPSPSPPSPVASPVAQPSPTPPTPNECTDSPVGWQDSYGDGCDWYEPEGACESYGDSWANNDGITANMACCVCGGGTSSPSPNTQAPTKSPTPNPTAPPTNPPTAAPTSSPTSSPTKAPTMAPTKAPVPSPITSPPVPSPVTSPPVPSPVAPPSPPTSPVDCQDTEEKFIVGTRSRSCKWVYKNPGRRCPKDQVSTLCPVSCASVTGNTCTPYDTIGKFTLPNGNQKTCRWVSVKDWTRCNNYVSHANCPVTCKVGI